MHYYVCFVIIFCLGPLVICLSTRLLKKLH